MSTRQRWLIIGGLTLTFVLSSVSGQIPISKIALADSSRVVSLFYDGQKKVFTTDADTVGQVLQRAGVKLEDGDLVEPKADTTVPSGLFNINVFRARPVIIIDGDKVLRTRSAFENPKLIATTAGLTVYPEDQFQSSAVTDFVSDRLIGQRLIIKRATPVQVAVDGKLLTRRTQTTSIGEFLAEQNIPLGEKDTVTPVSTAPISPNLRIGITRVSEAVVTKEETIARTVKTDTDPNLAKGTTQVKTEGSDGHRQVTYRIHYHDGIEIARETLTIAGQTEPVTKVVVVGTKVSFAGSVEYWRPMVVEAATANGIDPNRMLRIMSCESGGNANASNGTHFGLFQYLRTTWRSAGGTDDNIFDGPTQIRLTAAKMAQSGYSAWACQ